MTALIFIDDCDLLPAVNYGQASNGIPSYAVAEAAMTLETSGRHLYEPLLGIVLFAMRDQATLFIAWSVNVRCAVARLQRALTRAVPNYLADEIPDIQIQFTVRPARKMRPATPRSGNG
jgi:hypothetical protein